MNVTTVQGDTVNVDGTGSKYGADDRVNNANVTSADIIATNGVIHVIDEVLLPQYFKGLSKYGAPVFTDR